MADSLNLVHAANQRSDQREEKCVSDGNTESVFSVLWNGVTWMIPADRTVTTNRGIPVLFGF